MVELVKILEERFREQYGYDENNESQRTGLANYKKDRRNELTQLFKDLGLEDSLDMFKTVEGKVAKVYWFYEDEVAFVNRIYRTVNGIVSINAHSVIDVVKGSLLPG